MTGRLRLHRTAAIRADERALAADAGLVRGVRWRLVAWSGGTTLIVLVALSIALYLSAARSLEATGTAPLVRRAEEIKELLEQPRGRPGPGYGFKFGGDTSGTFALLLGRDGRVGNPRLELPDGLPNRDSLSRAVADGRDLRVAAIGTTPDPDPHPTDLDRRQ